MSVFRGDIVPAFPLGPARSVLSGGLDPAAGEGVRLVTGGSRVRPKGIGVVGVDVAAVTGSTVMAAVIGSKAEAVGSAVVAALTGPTVGAATTGSTVAAAMIGFTVVAALIGSTVGAPVLGSTIVATVTGAPVVAAVLGYITEAGHAALEDPHDRLFACCRSEPPSLFKITSGNFD